jgi:hypothetical protein
VLDCVCAKLRVEVERYFVSLACKRNFLWFKIAYLHVDGGRICVCVCACVRVLFQLKQKQYEIWAVILLTRVVAGTSHMAVSYGQ